MAVDVFGYPIDEQCFSKIPGGQNEVTVEVFWIGHAVFITDF